MKDPFRSLRNYLSIPEDMAEKDLTTLEEGRVEGSCEWLINSDEFFSWEAGKQPEERLFWLSGKPGAGKTVTATAVIRHLEVSNRYCSYFFFKDSVTNSSSTSALLRSIAFQMARGNFKVRKALQEIREDDSVFNKDDARAVWQKIFLGGVFAAELTQPHFWVIDALDECCDRELLISFLAKIDPDFPLRIFLTSRKQRVITDAFRAAFSTDLVTSELSTEVSSSDIRKFLVANSWQLPVQRPRLIDDLVQRSDGNFLWTSLVLKELRRAHTEEDIQRIMDDVPAGMDSLYERILNRMSEKPHSMLTKAILVWTVCAVKPLTIEELESALFWDISQKMLDLTRTIEKECGDLITVDQSQSKVHLVHKTARDFLTKATTPGSPQPFIIDRFAGHTQLAEICLKYLVSPNLAPPKFANRKPSTSSEGDKFSRYACTYFSNHLVNSKMDKANVGSLSKLLNQFLKTNVLSWIEFVARNGDLSPLVNVAKHFKTFPREFKPGHRAEDGHRDTIVFWGTDLVHLVTRFGKIMIQHPESIFFLIPPLCPTESSIYKLHGNNSMGLSVKGLAPSSWDEKRASMNYGGIAATAVACNSGWIAVGLKNGHIIGYYEVTYQEAFRLENGEQEIKLLQFTSAGNLLASSDRSEIKIWNTKSLQVVSMIPLALEVIGICFLEENTILQGITRTSHCLSWEVATGKYNSVVEIPEPDQKARSHFRRRITKVAFSPQLSILAIAHRNDPIWLWDLQQNGWVPGACRKYPSGSDFSVNDMIFNPDPSVNLLVTGYSDGDLVLFDVRHQEKVRVEQHVGPQILAISPDGRTLASGNSFSIQLFEAKTLRRIYVLETADYVVSGLAFLCNSYRFTDIGDDQCNIWEPLVLPLTDNDQPLPAPDKVVTTESLEDVTSLVCYPKSKYVFCGRASGAVDLYNTEKTEVLQQICKQDVGIQFLATCSGSGAILASVDTSTTVSVRRLWFSAKKWGVKPPLWAKRMNEPVTQIILDPSGEKLLIVTNLKMTVVIISSAGGHSPPSSPVKSGAYWSQRLSNPTQLVSHEYNAFRFWVWDKDMPKEVQPPANTDVFSGFRSRDPDASSQRPVLLRLADGLAKLGEASQLLGDVPRKSSNSDPKSETHLPRGYAFDRLAAETKLIIGIKDFRLLFLDTDTWICSVSLTEFFALKYKRHFFLPLHWLPIKSELVITLTLDGDVMIGKGKEIAIFRKSLGFGTLRELVE